MKFGCLLCICLGFLLLASITALSDCIIVANMQEHFKERKLRFVDAHLVFYCVVFCLMTIISSKTADFSRQNVKNCLNSKQLRYSLYQRNGMVQNGLAVNSRFSKFSDVSDLKSGDLFSALFQFRWNTKQKFTFYPATLKQYFQERQTNGNTVDLMKYEWLRYESFRTFPDESPARPMRLAQNGFYYNGCGESDSVTCFSCGLVHQGWKDGDIVSDIHARYSPNCPFLTGADKSNVGIHTNGALSAPACAGGETNHSRHSEDVEVKKQCQHSSYDDVAFNKRRQHKYPDFESFQYRMDSFTGWPATEIIEPFILADAGFFYAGFGDCVRCFSCGGGLRNWEYGDGPREEHERWFPECLFLLEQKGQTNKHKEPQATSDVSNSRSPVANGTGVVKEIKQTGNLSHDFATSPINDGRNETAEHSNNPGDQNASLLAAAEPKYLKDENERLKHQLTCKICMDKESNVVFIPCGHMVSCETCAPNIRKCAICRQLITGRVKAFMS